MPSPKIVLTTTLLLLATLSLLAACVLQAHAQVPADLPPITVSTLVDAAPGYVFLSNFVFDHAPDNVPYLLVLDNSGYPVRYQEMTASMNFDFKLQPDGTFTYSDGLGFARIRTGTASRHDPRPAIDGTRRQNTGVLSAGQLSCPPLEMDTQWRPPSPSAGPYAAARMSSPP